MERLNEYRIMWVFVFFDLPTDTSVERKAHAQFRKDILKQGFARFQFSIYTRNCPSRELAELHIDRVKKILPELGKIGMLTITDKQFSMMELFYGKKKQKGAPEGFVQLELF